MCAATECSGMQHQYVVTPALRPGAHVLLFPEDRQVNHQQHDRHGKCCCQARQYAPGIETVAVPAVPRIQTKHITRNKSGQMQIVKRMRSKPSVCDSPRKFHLPSPISILCGNRCHGEPNIQGDPYGGNGPIHLRASGGRVGRCVLPPRRTCWPVAQVPDPAPRPPSPSYAHHPGRAPLPCRRRYAVAPLPEWTQH
jgi:hypothetical protein